jgi:hypothetical protein
LDARWTTEFSLLPGGPYSLKVTSVGRASAGEESDMGSHGHIPASGSSKLRTERQLYVRLPSPPNPKRPWRLWIKRSRTHEWDLRLDGQSKYHDYEGNHREATPIVIQMRARGPGVVTVIESFHFQQSVSSSAVERCGWANLRASFDPIKWEILNLPAP